ncbi:MAG: hypothetical protein ACO2O4_02365 [Minisyncoccia bacterium]|jgi:hypothetical protein
MAKWILMAMVGTIFAISFFKLFVEENCYRIEKNYILLKKKEFICKKGLLGEKEARRVEWKPFWAE